MGTTRSGRGEVVVGQGNKTINAELGVDRSYSS
jgi:hypothetical protein